MKEINDCLSLPLIALDTSEEIGVLTHFITDPVENRIVGFALTTGEWYTERKAILFPDVSAFGVDAVIVRAANAVQPITDVSELHEYVKEDREKRVRQAISASGQSLGTLTDWAFDERSSLVVQYRLERSNGDGVAWVPRDSFVRSGRAVVIIDTTNYPLDGGSSDSSGGGGSSAEVGSSSESSTGTSGGGASAGGYASASPAAAYASPSAPAYPDASGPAIAAPVNETPAAQTDTAPAAFTSAYAPSAPTAETAPPVLSDTPSSGVSAGSDTATAGYSGSATAEPDTAVEEEPEPAAASYAAPPQTEDPSYAPSPAAEATTETTIAADTTPAMDQTEEDEDLSPISTATVEEAPAGLSETAPLDVETEPVSASSASVIEEVEEGPYTPAQDVSPAAEVSTTPDSPALIEETTEEEFDLTEAAAVGGNGTAIEEPLGASATIDSSAVIDDEEEDATATIGSGASMFTDTPSTTTFTPAVEELPEEEATLEESAVELPDEAPAMAAASTTAAAPQAEQPVAEQLKEAINRNKEGIIPFVVGKYSDRTIYDDDGRQIVSQGQQITLEIASSASRCWKLYDLWIAAQSSPSGED